MCHDEPSKRETFSKQLSRIADLDEVRNAKIVVSTEDLEEDEHGYSPWPEYLEEEHEYSPVPEYLEDEHE